MSEPVLIPIYGRASGGRRGPSIVVTHARVDADDAEFIGQFRWRRLVMNDRVYARTNTGESNHVLMHRMLLGLEPGDPRQGDHVNRDGLDNQRSNLRIVTQAQNLQNKSAAGNRDSSSQYRGVSWKARANSWAATARIGGSMRHIGLFKCEHEAGFAAANYRRRHMTHSVEPLLDAHEATVRPLELAQGHRGDAYEEAA